MSVPLNQLIPNARRFVSCPEQKKAISEWRGCPTILHHELASR